MFFFTFFFISSNYSPLFQLITVNFIYFLIHLQIFSLQNATHMAYKIQAALSRSAIERLCIDFEEISS